MDKLWRLLTAIFLIAASTAVLLITYVLFGSGTGALAPVLLWASLFGILFGIAKGLLVIIDYHRENEKEE